MREWKISKTLDSLHIQEDFKSIILEFEDGSKIAIEWKPSTLSFSVSAEDEDEPQ